MSDKVIVNLVVLLLVVVMYLVSSYIITDRRYDAICDNFEELGVLQYNIKDGILNMVTEEGKKAYQVPEGDSCTFNLYWEE